MTLALGKVCSIDHKAIASKNFQTRRTIVKRLKLSFGPKQKFWELQIAQRTSSFQEKTLDRLNFSISLALCVTRIRTKIQKNPSICSSWIGSDHWARLCLIKVRTQTLFLWKQKISSITFISIFFFEKKTTFRTSEITFFKESIKEAINSRLIYCSICVCKQHAAEAPQLDIKNPCFIAFFVTLYYGFSFFVSLVYEDHLSSKL